MAIDMEENDHIELSSTFTDISKRKDGSLTKKILTEGDTTKRFPRAGAKCTVNLSMPAGDNEQVQDTKDPITFILGEGCEHGICSSIEYALKRFRLGEKSQLMVRRTPLSMDGSIVPTTEMLYTVELLDFTQVPGHWELSFNDRLALAESFKARGTEFFKAGKIQLAKRYYKRVILYAHDVGSTCKSSHSTTIDACSTRQTSANIDSYRRDLLHLENTKPSSSEECPSSCRVSKEGISENSSSLDNKHILHDSKSSTLAVIPDNPLVDDKSANKESSLHTNCTELQHSNNIASSDCNVSSSCSDVTNESSLVSSMNSGMERGNSLVIAAYLNLALCYLKLGRNLSALEACDNVLDLLPDCEKALYRRGLAHLAMESFEEAVSDFSAAHKLCSHNSAILKQLTIARRQLEEYKRKEKLTYGGMFTKFATCDSLRDRERDGARGDVFTDIGQWNNDLAKDMMTLEQEMAAFGEEMPKPRHSSLSYDDDGKENEQPDSDYD